MEYSQAYDEREGARAERREEVSLLFPIICLVARGKERGL